MKDINYRAELLLEEAKKFVVNGDIVICDELFRISNEIDKLAIKEILIHAADPQV